jgi:hypothetical protein
VEAMIGVQADLEAKAEIEDHLHVLTQNVLKVEVMIDVQADL